MSAPSLRDLLLAAAMGATLLTVPSPKPLSAQEGRSPMRLATPVEETQASFSRIRTLRVLTDGTLLLSDRRMGPWFHVDFKRLPTAEVGRQGAGPGEYREITQVHALGGDTTLMEDRRSGRWLFFEGTRYLRMETHSTAGWRGKTILGMDAAGRVFEVAATRMGQASGVPVMPIATNAESLAVVAHPSRLRGGDTLIRLRGRFRGQRTVRHGSVEGVPHFFELFSPLGVEDQAVIFRDGSLAVAYSIPYRVDWRDASGRWVRGAPLPVEKIAVTAELKRHFILEVFPGREAGPAPDQYPGWPQEVPAFLNNALFATPGGQVAIERTRLARTSRRKYDVVNRQGNLEGAFELAPGERLLGFANSFAFVAFENADGLETVRRYTWSWPARSHR